MSRYRIVRTEFMSGEVKYIIQERLLIPFFWEEVWHRSRFLSIEEAKEEIEWLVSRDIKSKTVVQ